MELSILLDELIREQEAENMAVCVGKGDQVIREVYKSSSGTINEFTKFDMASVTKILATAPLMLIALNKNKLRLEDKISGYFDCPEDKRNLTIRNLLTHTMGIGHKSLLGAHNHDHIAEYILNIPLDRSVGSNVLYSCPAFILLGKILEKVFSKPLDALFSEMIAAPLGMEHTSFVPRTGSFVNSNLEAEKCGIVNDYNCQFLGGVAGNAGIFSNMHDMKKYARALLSGLDALVSPEIFDLATRNHTAGMDESRGLGFLVVDERYAQTGRLFPTGSIGHCGHTGQSVFVDLKSGLYAIILSDLTISTTRKYGHEKYENVMKNREKIHNQIFDLLKSQSV